MALKDNRPLAYFGVATLLILLLYSSLFLWSLYQTQKLLSVPPESNDQDQIHQVSTQPYVPDRNDSDEACDVFPLGFLSDVQIIIKTGATEIYERLPPLLLTYLRCIPDLLIFSDVAQHVGDYVVHDAFADLPDSYLMDHPDFDLYRKLQLYHSTGQDVAKLKSSDGGRAYALDKFKFLPMVDKAFAMQPNKTWYFFIEADTFVFWSTFVQWISRLDPEKHLYLGVPLLYDDVVFGYGGAGYLLSKEALQKLVDNRPEDSKPGTSQFGLNFTDILYGDAALAMALSDSGVKIQSAAPVLNPSDERWHAYASGQWCKPLVSLHHVTPEGSERLWAFDQGRGDLKAPITHEEFFDWSTKSGIAEEKDDWQNACEDIQLHLTSVEEKRIMHTDWMHDRAALNAYSSRKWCRQACQEWEDCVQWTFQGYKCLLDREFKKGAPKPPPGDGQRYHSGWNLTRIERLKPSEPCKETEWMQH